MKEVLIDTNIFIRYLIKDVISQYEQARQLFEDIEAEKIKGLVSVLIVNEIIWILENYYDLKREIYLPKIIQLLVLKDIKIIEIDKDLLMEILGEMTKTGLDFTDIYLSKTAGAQKIFSFDKKLIKAQVEK